MGEVGVDFEDVVEDMMIGKFFSVVVGSGFDQVSMVLEKLVDYGSDLVGVFAWREPHEGVFAHSIYDGHKDWAAVETDDGVHLQVAEAGLFFNDRRTLINRDPVFEGSSFVLGVTPPLTFAMALP